MPKLLGQVQIPDATTLGQAVLLGGDASIYRDAADSLRLDDLLRSRRPNATDAALLAGAGAEAVDRFLIRADGYMQWGDGTLARDVSLYRALADVLKTDDNLVVALSAAIGQAAVTANERLRVTSALTDAAASQYGIRSALSNNHAAAAAINMYAVFGGLTVSGTGNDTGIIVAMYADMIYGASGVGSNVNAGNYTVQLSSSGGGISTARGCYYRVDNNHATNLIANALGIAIANNIGVGAITNNYGIQVAALAGTGFVAGIQVAEPSSGATRRAIDLLGTSGTPAGGITFGGDVNLYRSAANELRTDDTFSIAGFKLPTGGGAGKVLTSDANGVGTWQALPLGSGSLISGTGAPAAGTGSDGAMYLDTANGRFYGPKAAGAWPAATHRLMPLAPTYAQLASG